MKVFEKIALMNQAFNEGKFAIIKTECISHQVTLVNPIPENVGRKDIIQLLASENGTLKRYVILADAFEFVDVESPKETLPDTIEKDRQSVRDDRLHFDPLPLPRPIAQFENPDVIL